VKRGYFGAGASGAGAGAAGAGAGAAGAGAGAAGAGAAGAGAAGAGAALSGVAAGFWGSQPAKRAAAVSGRIMAVFIFVRNPARAALVRLNVRDPIKTEKSAKP
jgi:hypothetical protein